jgi:hypothetical protein
MSRLESDAKPILTPMILGHRTSLVADQDVLSDYSGTLPFLAPAGVPSVMSSATMGRGHRWPHRLGHLYRNVGSDLGQLNVDIDGMDDVPYGRGIPLSASGGWDALLIQGPSDGVQRLTFSVLTGDP